jgi:putative PIN family toxin of toxin-antitoxin system
VAIKVVIDTNIWVSALINPFGYPARIRKSFEKGVFQVVVSEPILEEVSDFLLKYGISVTSVAKFLKLIEKS